MTLPTDWTSRFESWVAPLLADQDVPGLALAVGDAGRLVYFRGFGERDRALGLPVTERTLFGIGSVTKSFTAVAILQLQEQGRLSVDDPVARHIPELRLPNVAGAHAMRIEHLLSHSAGLPPLPTLNACLARALMADPEVDEKRRAKLPPPVDDFDQLIAFLNAREIDPIGLPGERFSYSNDGYALLGLVVERASGEAYEAYVRDHILAPAGMEDSRFDIAPVVDGPDTTRLYNAHTDDAGRRAAREAGAWWDAGPMCAAGFLRSSARDMLRYLEIFRNGGVVAGRRLLTPDGVAAMTRPRVPCDIGMAYGFGLMVSEDYGDQALTLVEHGGNIKGAAAWVSVVPERGLSVVGLSNLSGAPTGRATLGAVHAALGLEPGRPRRAARPGFAPVAPLADYVGRFASEEDANLVIAETDGALTLTTAGETFPLVPLEEDAFRVESHGNVGHMTFLRGADGRVEAVRTGFRHVRRASPASEPPSA
jgi:CubicO group peptidase (beta-lactamase class C family)